MTRSITDVITAYDPTLMFPGCVIGLTETIRNARDAILALDPNLFCSSGSNNPASIPGDSIIAEQGKRLSVNVYPDGTPPYDGDIYPMGYLLFDAANSVISAFPYSTSSLAAGSSPYFPGPGDAVTSAFWEWSNPQAGVTFGHIEVYSDLAMYTRTYPKIPRGIVKVVVQEITWTDDDLAPFTTTTSVSGDRSWLNNPDYLAFGSIDLRGSVFHTYGGIGYPVDWNPSEKFIRIFGLYSAP